MLKPKQPLMTADEFLLWNLEQEDKYELVDGVPVLLHAQAGAAQEHDGVVVNIIGALHKRLRGGPCRPSTSDQAVRTSIRKIRRPDVTVECGPRTPGALEAREPVAVFEVLSPSNRPSELIEKIEEYRRQGAIRHIVLIEPGTVRVTHLRRGDDDSWSDLKLLDLEDVLQLDPPGVELTLAEIYEGIVFPPDEPSAMA